MVQVWAGKLVSETIASICSSCVLACTVCQTFDIEDTVLMIWWRRSKVNRTLIQARPLDSLSSTTEVCQYSVIVWITNVQNYNYLISIICTVNYRPSFFAGAQYINFTPYSAIQTTVKLASSFDYCNKGPRKLGNPYWTNITFGDISYWIELQGCDIIVYNTCKL